MSLQQQRPKGVRHGGRPCVGHPPEDDWDWGRLAKLGVTPRADGETQGKITHRAAATGADQEYSALQTRQNPK